MAAIHNCPDCASFSGCGLRAKWISTAPLAGGPKRTPQPKRIEDGIVMDESVEKSCWGVAAKAVIGFAGIILLAWLVSGAETAAVLAAS